MNYYMKKKQMKIKIKNKINIKLFNIIFLNK